MTRTEQAYVKRIDARRERLLVALRIINVWLDSPYCAPSAEDMCARIAEFVTKEISQEDVARSAEESRQRGCKA